MKKRQAKKPREKTPASPPQGGGAFWSPEEQELARRIVRRNLVNIGKKANADGSLKASEIALAQAAMSNIPVGGNFSGRAKDQIALAKIMGISPKTLTRWRKLHPDFPKPNADYSWDTGTVIEFCRRHSLLGEKGKEATDDLTEKERLTLRILSAKATRDELRAREFAGSLVPWDKVRSTLSHVLGTLRSLVDAMPRDLAPRANPGNPGHAEKVLRDWKDTRLLAILSGSLENLK